MSPGLQARARSLSISIRSVGIVGVFNKGENVLEAEVEFDLEKLLRGMKNRKSPLRRSNEISLRTSEGDPTHFHLVRMERRKLMKWRNDLQSVGHPPERHPLKLQM